MIGSGRSKPVSAQSQRFQPAFFHESGEFGRAIRAGGVPAAPADEITLSFACYVTPGVSPGDNPVTACVDGLRTSRFVRIPVHARPA